MNREKLLSSLLDQLAQERDFVLLWNGRMDEDNYQTYVFTSPVKCIYCFEKREFIEALSQIEGILSQGYHLAGFISYEAGLCLENIVPFESSADFPLLWFGVYEPPAIYDHRDGHFCGAKNDMGRSRLCQINNVRNTVEKDVYIRDVTAVREAIARGDTYQVNYTFKHKFGFDGNAEDLFFNLCMKQSASYTAFVRCMDWDILSLSPELFFRRKGSRAVVKPMKGTIERGIDNAGDRRKAGELHHSIKNRAENVMIVDLLRNDLGRISRTGSVKVDKLYEVEKYETLFQMTSTVRSELNENVRWLDLFKSMFPCGSVTGAPKINTMRIIDRLEKEPRGVYTGSIGFISPDNTSVFNVAIRTVVLDRAKKRGEMGIGSGIVYDSDPYSEFDECLLKADFLTAEYADFQLIETMLWQDGEFYLLDLHLKRLRESAEYFQFDYDQDQILEALEHESETFQIQEKRRTRLLLHRDGAVTISSTTLDDMGSEPKRVMFSTARTDPSNRFLYHKTTNRKLYNNEFQKARAEGYYDVLFLNARGEVTEGAISNVLIENNGMFYTPEVRCGLLNGVFRRHLLERDFPLEEKALSEGDILNAEKIYLTNSVRGMVEVSLVTEEPNVFDGGSK